tara:strand:+ start:201 stop:587 length:387 start_codon:yes stop_codon:yes gene_type:complete
MIKLDFTDEKFHILHISKAIGKLTDVVCNIDGEIETEEDFNNNIKWKVRTDENNSIVWTNVAPEGVTFATVESKQAEMEAEYNALAWKRNRQSEYPSIEDLVVALYDSDDKAAVDEKRAAVKLKYPKP